MYIKNSNFEKHAFWLSVFNLTRNEYWLSVSIFYLLEVACISCFRIVWRTNTQDNIICLLLILLYLVNINLPLALDGIFSKNSQNRLYDVLVKAVLGFKSATSLEKRQFYCYIDICFVFCFFVISFSWISVFQFLILNFKYKIKKEVEK